MFRALNIAATGMSAQQTQLDGISNNIANANTDGYKKQRIDFQDLLYQTVRGAGTQTTATTVSPTGLQLGSGVRVAGSARLFSQGNILVTDNPLDIAIEGDGFFVVQQPNGTPAYTRSGALKKDSQGQLVNVEGYPLDPPILIPTDALSVSIGRDGTVNAVTQGQPAPVQLGQINIATFVNPSGLSSAGHSLYTATSASGQAQIGSPATDNRGPLLQGALEKSNVDVVQEMVGLISTQRAYEVNSKIITAADDMLRAATQMK